MSADVIALVPNSALCVDRQQIAARLHQFADRLQEDEFGDVERVVIVFETEGRILRRTYGRPTTNMELVGLLEYAKNGVMNPPPSDED